MTKELPRFAWASKGLAGLACLVLVGWCPTQSSSSANPEQHSFYECLAATAPTDGDTVRVYFDRMGSLYPPKSYLPGNNFRQREYAQDLRAWYYAPAHKAQLKALSRLCEVECLDDVQAGDYEDCKSHWWRIQDALARRAAQEIDQRTGGTRVAVALVHGYNNSDEARPFVEPTRELRQQPALRNAVWVQVRWDGLHNSTGIGIWGAGQLNARYAGIGWRRVLTRTRHQTPVRMFTHSSGAIVAFQSLWNSSPQSNQDTLKDEILQAARWVPTPTHSDIRVGTMVPASTPLVFLRYGSRTVGPADNPAVCKPGTGPAYRVMLGQNARDFAVSKMGIAAAIAGTTTLGCEKEAFEQANTNCQCGLQRVEFSQAEGGKASPAPFAFNKKGTLEQHDWGLYWQRKQSEEFLQRVLN